MHAVRDPAMPFPSPSDRCSALATGAAAAERRLFGAGDPVADAVALGLDPADLLELRDALRALADIARRAADEPAR